jgi:hypothetical protein
VASKIPGGGGEVKLNFKGMGELLRSPAIASELRTRMRRVQSAVPGSELTWSRVAGVLELRCREALTLTRPTLALCRVRLTCQAGNAATR